MLIDLVLYAGPLVGAVDGVGFGFLMRFCVHAAMGLYSDVFSFSVLGVGLMKAFCALGDGVFSTGTLVGGGMSNIVRVGGIRSVVGTLGDLCVLLIFFICV